MKGFHTHRKHKNAHKRTKTKKAALNELKKHLRGKKSPIRLFAFLCFLCAFCAFLCVNKKDSIFNRIKTSKRKKIACLMFCAFYALYAHEKRLSGLITLSLQK